MLNDLRFRLRSLLRRNVVEEELNEELRFHFERETEKYRKSGISDQEARRLARLAFGGQEQIKEDCREARGTSLVEGVVQDVRYAARQLLANPTFATVIILTLALSIGANSAIFSVIDSVLIKPLPYPNANRIVRLFLSNATYPKFPLNPFDFRDYRSRSKSFESLAAFTRGDLQLSGGSGQPVRLNGFYITSGYFRVLGLNPELGREFDEKAELPGNGHQVILSDRLWRGRFGAAPDIVGRKITLDMQPYTVVGVMPPGTQHPGNEYHSVAYGENVDVWSPFTFAGDPSQRGSHFTEGIGRLKDGVTIGQASAEMNSIMAQLGRDYPNNDAGWQVLVVPLYHEVVGSSERILLVLLGAVGMVLLIACANAANLMLARAAARQRELAVRTALGAQRARLIRQLLTESLLIALLGGALGLAMAVGGVKALVSLLPIGFPRAHEIHVNAPVFLFTFLVSAITGIIFGLIPAIQASRTDPKSWLHEGCTQTGSGRQSRLRNVLVISEVSLACVLLIGAGLMLRSLLNLLNVAPGFQQEHVLTASISLPFEDYKTTDAVGRFYDGLTTSLGTSPGVESVGVGTDLPWTGYNGNFGGWGIEGKQLPPGQEFHARLHVASPDYFRALGIPLLRGRLFTEADKNGAPNVLIINEALAAKYFLNEDPLGKRINMYGNDHPSQADWFTIIGVVGDVKDEPNSAGAEASFWWSILQQPFPFGNMSLVVHANSDPRQLVSVVQNQVKRLNPALAVAEVQTMDQIVEGSVATPRFAFVLVGLFAGLAIVLAAIGTYGVIAYSVSRRTPEFGLRVALGAQRFDILRLVLAQAAGLVLAGTALGVVFALAFARVLKSLIYDVSPADPLTFAGVTFLVIAIAVLACYIPARKATKADPMIALRAE